MKHIEQAIGDLLLRHNCVIVPTFGGFVAEQLSAKIDYDKGVMLPPRKSLLFNKQLISNDGLLINELSQREEISFDEAHQKLNETVTAWNTRLKKGERIELDRVGMLFLDAEKNLCFEQDRFFNLLLSSFGMDQVHFITQEDVEIIRTKTAVIEKVPELIVVEEEPAVILSVLDEEQPKIIPHESKEETEPKIVPIVAPTKSKNRKWKYLAAACILPIAFYSIWIPVRTDVLQSGVISIKDFNPFYKTSEGNYVQTEFTKDLTFEKSADLSLEDQINDLEVRRDAIPYRFSDDTYIFVDIREENASTTEVNEVPEDPTKEVVQTQIVQPNSMNVIVGCFGNESNAKNLVAKLKENGMNGFILDLKNGLHRVSAGAGVSDEAISEIRSKASSLGFDGWILK